jgi:RNase P/RNase MRP subunit p30
MTENSSTFKGGTADTNRQLVEKKGVTGIILDHSHNKKDRLYERDSGLNQVICKLAKQKNVTFIIDINELFVDDLKLRAEILGRIIQNLRLINKFGNSLKIVTPKNISSLSASSLLSVLGLKTSIIKSALE